MIYIVYELNLLVKVNLREPASCYAAQTRTTLTGNGTTSSQQMTHQYCQSECVNIVARVYICIFLPLQGQSVRHDINGPPYMG